MKRFAKFTLITLILVTGFALVRGTAPQVATGTWQNGPDMNEARTGAAAVTLDDGRVLVFGGNTGSGATNAVQVFSDGSWSDLGAVMLDARSGHTATALADGRILIAGGENSSGALSSLEIYDPSSGAFSSAGTLSAGRKAHGAARLPSGSVLIIGGSDGTNALASSEVYDPESGSVSAGPSMSAPRSGVSATRLLDGKVLIAGGNNGEADLASTLIYNPADGSFAAGADLSAPRSGHSAVLLPNNNSVLISGGSGSASAELYVPWTGIVSATGAMSAVRDGAASTGFEYEGVAITAGGSGSASSEFYGYATVMTDLDDYAPGNTVYIFGSGWQPGETVTLHLHEVPEIHDDQTLTAVADENGVIFNSDFAPAAEDFGARFYLTATGASSQAQTTFKDSVQAVNITSPTGAVPVTFTSLPATVTINFTYSTSSTGTTTAVGRICSSSNCTPAASIIASSAAKTITSGASQSNFVQVTIPAGTANGSYTAFVEVNNAFVSGGPASRNDAETDAAIVNVPTNVAPAVTADNDTFSEGTSKLYSASWTDTASQTHTCTIDFGDGGGPVAGTIAPAQPSSSGTCSLSHTYADGPDSRTITVSVSDGSLSGSDTATATVNNLNPDISSVANDGPITEGSSALITVTATDPAGVNDPLSYQFDCDGDSVFEIGPQAGNTHACFFADDGNFTVNVRVTDGDGGSDTDSTSVTVNNQAASVDTPVVTPEPSDEAALASVSATFSDPGTDSHTCTVNFGDGHSSAGSVTETVGNPTTGSCSASHTYEDDSGAGTFTVTVTVNDGDADGSNNVAHDVNNLPPTISNVSNNGPVNEGSAAQITVTASDPAGAADPLTYSFDCDNNGSYETAGVGNQGSCTFNDNGSFTVGVKVDDGDGGTDTDSTMVTVLNVAPTITSVVAGAAVSCGGSNSITVNFTDPGTLDTFSASINWGDGNVENIASVSSGFSATHTYASAGPHNVSVTVTDDDGGVSNPAGTATLIVNFTIVGGGVQPPINNDGSSVFKFKSTIPVKLRVQDCNGSAVSGLQITIMLTMVSGATPGLEINEPISTSAADSGFMLRYDVSGQQYIYNLATKPLPDPSAIYQIKLTIVSTGQVVTVNFGLKP